MFRSQVRASLCWLLNWIPFFEDTRGDIYLVPRRGFQREHLRRLQEIGGKIYRITPDGESSPLLRLTRGFNLDAGNRLPMTTSTPVQLPDGLIYKLARTVALRPQRYSVSEEKYVWAMTFDDAGNLYAATGTGGKIYKITPDGQTSVLYDSDERNILCLALSSGNAVCR